MKRLSKKGFTLMELLLALAIMGMVFVVVYPFFNSNYKTLNTTEIMDELQSNGQKSIEAITQRSLQCSSISQIVDTSGTDQTALSTEVNTSKLILSYGTAGKSILELRNGSLYFESDDTGAITTANIKIAEDVSSIHISPVPGTSTFDKAAGFSITINLMKKDSKDSIRSQISFRNANH